MKFEVLGKNVIYMVYTRDIYTEEEITKMRAILDNIKWDEDKYVMLPSEYVDRVEVLEK